MSPWGCAWLTVAQMDRFTGYFYVVCDMNMLQGQENDPSVEAGQGAVSVDDDFGDVPTNKNREVKDRSYHEIVTQTATNLPDPKTNNPIVENFYLVEKRWEIRASSIKLGFVCSGQT